LSYLDIQQFKEHMEKHKAENSKLTFAVAAPKKEEKKEEAK